jgi:hypothetical protein
MYIPITDEDQSDSLQERMNNYNCNIKDINGNYDHAVVTGKVLNSDDVYCDASFLPPSPFFEHLLERQLHIPGTNCGLTKCPSCVRREVDSRDNL